MGSRGVCEHLMLTGIHASALSPVLICLKAPCLSTLMLIDTDADAYTDALADAYRASGTVQVAKSIQMAMGLHDEDVTFFLAADEPATYLQVQKNANPRSL